MEKYTAYKPSGIKWIGEIPEHWVAQRFTHYFTFGKGLSITKADLKPNGISVISYGQIHSRLNNGIAILPEMIRYVDESYLQTDNNCLLNRNDFIFADTSEDILGSGNFAFNDLNTPIFAGYHTLIARPKGLECPKYIAFFMSSVNYRRQIQSLVNGVKVYSIGRNIIKKSTILLPPLPEQLSIVAFLEKATANIDAYIKQTEQEINTLNELKQAEIAQVVTKGLNPDAPMKDSGIAWIGEIPEHWECKRIGSTYIENKHINSDLGCNEAYKFNYGSLVRKDEDVKLEEVADVYSKYTVISKNDIIINGLNLNYDFVTQRVAIVEQKGIITSAYVAITPREDVNSEYFSYLFKSMDAKKLFNGMGTGIRLTLGFGELKKQQIPIPPKDEQDLIVKNIKAKTSKIEEYITALKSEIAQMQEYKQRLISDVVTGKMKV